MAVGVATAEYEGDPGAEPAELSFSAGARIALVDDETYGAGSGWRLGYIEGESPQTAALVPESYLALEPESALALSAAGPGASEAPEALWRQYAHAPLEDELQKQSSRDAAVFRSYRFVLALSEGSLQFWRSADRSAFPRVCHIELPTIHSPRKVAYQDHDGSEPVDFQFEFGFGEVMRLRAGSPARCSEWVRALTLLAGPNWDVLSGYALSQQAPKPPQILGVKPGDREATVTVRSRRDCRVDYFSIRSRLAEPPSLNPPGVVGGADYGGTGRVPWGGGAVEPMRSEERASDRCTTVVSTLPEGRPVTLPVRGLRNCVSNIIEISCGNYDAGEGQPAVLRVSPQPRAPGPPEIAEVIEGPDCLDLVLFIPDPGGAPIETITASVLPIPPYGPPPEAPRVAAVVPTRPGYGDRGQRMRVAVLGLTGGWPHVVTVTARNAGGEGQAVAVMAHPRSSGRAHPSLEPAGGVGTSEERQVLQGLAPSVLRKQAVAAGVEAAKIEAAEDGPNPKQDLISLILERGAMPQQPIPLPSPGAAASGAGPPAVEVGWQGKPITPLPDGVEYWQGKYDHEPQEPGDLAFKKYDIVCVTVKHGIGARNSPLAVCKPLSQQPSAKRSAANSGSSLRGIRRPRACQGLLLAWLPPRQGPLHRRRVPVALRDGATPQRQGRGAERRRRHTGCFRRPRAGRDHATRWQAGAQAAQVHV